MSDIGLFLQQVQMKPSLGSRIVSVNDMDFIKSTAIEINEANKLVPIPYCMDFQKHLLVNAVGLHPLAAANATFHYTYLRAHAKHVICLPIQRIPKTIKSPDVVPFLLFSPGRCGSTLMTKISSGLGITSLSEPDIYSQVALQVSHGSNSANEIKLITHLLRYASTLLLRPFSQISETKVLVKFRSDVNRAPWIVLSSFIKKPKTIFLLRDFCSWCESRRRAFSNSLEQNLEIYTRSLLTLRFLRQHTDCLLIHYEEIVENRTKVFSQLASFYEVELNYEVIDAIANEDSQAGTILAREQLSRQLSNKELAEIASLWKERAPQALLNELKLQG